MPTAIQHYIGGLLAAGTSKRSAPVFNPATGEETVYGKGDEETAAFMRNGIRRLCELINERQQIDLPLSIP